MLTTLTAPLRGPNRRALPEVLPLVKDTSQSLKMPREPVDLAREKALQDGRTLQSVIQDAVLLFATRRLVPRRIPRRTYGSGPHPTPASVLMSELSWETFRARADESAEWLGWRPTISAVVWTHLTDYAADQAPEPWPENTSDAEAAPPLE